MSDRGFLVLGPESSGTRLVTEILISGGCAGSYRHHQPFDNTKFGSLSLVVLRRSVPHNGNWLNLNEIIDEFFTDRSITIVVTTRDFFCLAKAQVEGNHVSELSVAELNIRSAYCLIFKELSDLSDKYDRYITVSYESLIRYQKHSQIFLLKKLGLAVPDKLVGVRDENHKYWLTGVD